MQYLSTQSMMTMCYLPQFDRKTLRYAIAAIVAIASSTAGFAVYA